MKYPLYQFMIGWTVSFIFLLAAAWLLKDYIPPRFLELKFILGVLLVHMALDTYLEVTKTKNE